MPIVRPIARSLLVLSVVIAGACVFGFRGQSPFEGEAELLGIETVQLELPPTELSIRGVASTQTLSWEGRWVALGATRDDALAHAREPELVWESLAGVGRLRAELPLEVRDLSELELLEVESAAYLAHEIRGAGDVFVAGIDAYLAIELAGGNVEVLGGLEQIVVDTEQGHVELRTAAAADVHSGGGDVFVEQDSPRELAIDTRGRVVVELAEVGNLTIDIAEAGAISIDLDGVAHLGGGEYLRTVGSGTRTLRVRSGGGPVYLRMIDAGGDETDTEG